MLTDAQIEETGRAIASVQLPDGCIPATPGGLADPWNHVEAAMALDVAGLAREAERAYEWLARSQRQDGSWAMSYRDGAPVDEGSDANFCAYLAAGAWHHHLATGDDRFLADLWPVLERAIDFTLGLQASGGEVFWARDREGRPWPAALLTSSSCIHLSLGCACAIAAWLGHRRPDWGKAQDRLRHAIEHRPEAFESRQRWSMDLYYPVLGRALEGEAAEERIRSGWDAFVVPGLGVRCVADRPWVTVAETCEMVIALDAIGWDEEARDLFAWTQSLRHEDGAYWTGITFPDGVLYPEERPTWTSGAVLLAADALAGQTLTSGLFRDDHLATVA